MEVDSIQNLELMYIAELPLPTVLGDQKAEAGVGEAGVGEARAEARAEGEVGGEERELINQSSGYLAVH